MLQTVNTKVVVIAVTKLRHLVRGPRSYFESGGADK